MTYVLAMKWEAGEGLNLDVSPQALRGARCAAVSDRFLPRDHVVIFQCLRDVNPSLEPRPRSTWLTSRPRRRCTAACRSSNTLPFCSRTLPPTTPTSSSTGMMPVANRCVSLAGRCMLVFPSHVCSSAPFPDGVPLLLIYSPARSAFCNPRRARIDSPTLQLPLACLPACPPACLPTTPVLRFWNLGYPRAIWGWPRGDVLGVGGQPVDGICGHDPGTQGPWLSVHPRHSRMPHQDVGFTRACC